MSRLDSFIRRMTAQRDILNQIATQSLLPESGDVLELGLGNGRTYSHLREVFPCLLYTSPSPRDGLLSRMPSSA